MRLEDLERQADRLALHVGLMSLLLQRGAPLSLVQSQCQSLRAMCKEFANLEDGPPRTWVQRVQLLPADVAAALAEGTQVPDDLGGFDDVEGP